MKTSLLMAFTLLVICLQANAQLKGFSLGPYIEIAKPTGSLDDTHKNGAGIGLGADIRLGKFGLTGSAGYMYIPGKTVNTIEGPRTAPAISAIPVRAGIKYRFVPLLYAKLEGGVANYTNGNGSAVIISPGIGLRILGLDVEAKYETWVNNGSSSFWGIKAGYNF
jgi:hypothetical protein